MFFRYAIGNLLARKGSTALAVVSIALVICASVLSLAFLHGLSDNMAATGRADNVAVIQTAVLQMSKSYLPREMIEQVKVLPQVASDNGEALVSPEGWYQIPAGDGETDVAARGVDPVAFQVHDQVKVVEGRLPTKGASELIIGKKLVGKGPQLHLGGTVKVGTEEWPIVGVFSAGSSALETELWGDRGRLSIALKRPDVLGLVVRAKSKDDVPGLISSVGAIRLGEGKTGGWGISEREYYDTTLGNVNAVLAAVAAIIVILTIGAMFAAANTLHASLSSRMAEFAALWVVGHRRGRLVSIIYEEALVLCAAAALLACALAAAFAGADVAALLGGEVEFQLPFGLPEVGAALALGLGIALIGAFYPSVQVMRRDLAVDLS